MHACVCVCVCACTYIIILSQAPNYPVKNLLFVMSYYSKDKLVCKVCIFLWAITLMELSTHVCECAYAHMCMHVCVCVHAHVHMHVCVCVSLCVCVCACMHVCVCVCVCELGSLALIL